MDSPGRICVMTGIEVGDLVWITSSEHMSRLKREITKGIVLSKIDDSWFRVYSSYWTSVGEKTNIQDFPAQMLKRVHKNENR